SHVRGETLPRVVLREPLGGGLDRPLHRDHAQPLEQLLLGAVAAVEAAHAHPGPLCDGRDGGVEALRGEHLVGGTQQTQVVACRLGLPAALVHAYRILRSGTLRYTFLSERCAPINGEVVMRAVVLREFGGPEMLVAEEVPDPVPGPGQVLIKVAVAGVTFVETQVRADRGPRRAELPAILGNGVAGTVTAVGEGVAESLI